ncbi:MAG: hypothetical protein E7617_05715 [Ruminococcaceae bacterium]|nr:hypothetical protein [Oscillospiraceae bacterium]
MECKPLKRKLYFRALKKIMKIRYKKPRFVYLGEEISGGALIVSNHEGTDAPMSLEIYLDKPIRMWGASEMNSGLKSLYKYQTQIYYHEKKHWNIHLARLFCLIASPLTHLFYSGLDLISTYHDAKLVVTMRESVRTIQSGCNIVAFPEDSTNGYLAELEGFHEGVVLFAEVCKMRGIDLPIFVTYFRKSDLTYIIDKPVLYSELAANGRGRAEIARILCDRCNELGKIDLDSKEESSNSKRKIS